MKNTSINKLYQKFPITSVCRADLKNAGFNIKGVDGGTMLEISSKMADAYCESGFWESLEIIGENLGIKKIGENKMAFYRKNEKFK